MHSQRIATSLFAFPALVCTSAMLMSGCGDSSRTTGTQLKISEEAKSQIVDMREMYKQEKGQKKEARTPKNN